MNKTIDIVKQAVQQANAKLAEDLKTYPRQVPFAWSEPGGYIGCSVRTQLTCPAARASMGGRVLGGFACSQRHGRMIVTWWDNNDVHQPDRGPATVEFLLEKLLDIQLPDEV